MNYWLGRCDWEHDTESIFAQWKWLWWRALGRTNRWVYFWWTQKSFTQKREQENVREIGHFLKWKERINIPGECMLKRWMGPANKKRIVKQGNDSARWFHIMKNFSAVAPKRRRRKGELPSQSSLSPVSRRRVSSSIGLERALSVSSTCPPSGNWPDREWWLRMRKKDVRFERAFSQSRVWKEGKGPFEGKIGLAGTTFAFWDEIWICVIYWSDRPHTCPCHSRTLAVTGAVRPEYTCECILPQPLCKQISYIYAWRALINIFLSCANFYIFAEYSKPSKRKSFSSVILVDCMQCILFAVPFSSSTKRMRKYTWDPQNQSACAYTQPSPY